MYDQMTSLLKSFDELFNDDFLLNADDQAIELRFKFMQELCKGQNVSYEKLMEELEFHCNSCIAEIAGC